MTDELKPCLLQKNAPCAAADALTRKEQAIHDAIASGQSVEAVIKREEAIKRMERERKVRFLEYAG